MDMVLFPILWSLLQTSTGTAITQWNPLTLQGAGLFHIAMGAVLGIAAFGRTQEKMAGANNGGASVPSSNFTAPSVPPATPTPSFSASKPTPSFSAPTPAPSFGASTTSSFSAPSAPMMSSTGKPMPLQPDQPEL